MMLTTFRVMTETPITPKPSWTIAPLPDDEQERLNALYQYAILDTPPEAAFDRLTRMAANRFGLPIALVSLVDKDRQWFKSHYGIDATETPRDLAFCAHVILQDEVMVVHDTIQDPRFAANPLVTDNPNIRFYAGAPLTTSNGHHLGTLCVIDSKPHPEFSETHQSELAELASIAMDEIELRQAIRQVHADLEALKQTQKALGDAQSKAEHIIQEKSQFIANISHELRTPMNGILGMVYLLNDTSLDPVQREYIDTINHSAQNLLLLVNDVLDLSKIEARELILERKPFDIKTSFIQTIKLLKPLADKKQIQLIHEVDPLIPDLIMGDPGRFAQIVTNLIGNAVKFTDKGNVEANLTYAPSQEQVVAVIKDSGIGIPENKRNLIFEKFVQGDAAITQKYGGTGLGLTITKQLVVMLGGTIGFESEINVGSRFWFNLPITLPSAPPESANDSANPANYAWCMPIEKAHVLIVEDHPVNQMFLVKLLKKFGFTAVDCAENGAQALDMVKKQFSANDRPYDAIFMDCMMPIMDGYEATTHIRRTEKISNPPYHTPIIAMTANAMAGDREACFTSGMDEYVSKPIQPERLKEVLQQWFVFSGNPKAVAALSAQPAVVQSPPIALDRLNMITDTDEERSAMLNLFLHTSSELISVMENSRRAQEYQQWSRAAHSLKGSASNLGMQALASLALKAEKDVTASYEERTLLLSHIQKEITRIRDYVTLNYPQLQI